MRPRPSGGTVWILAAMLLLPGAIAVLPFTGASPGPAAPADSVVLASEGTAPASGTVTVAPGYVPAPGIVALGPMPAGSTLRVAVGLSLSDPAGLRSYVSSEYQPGSPLYKSYLTPAEIGARYGPSANAVRAAVDYFEGFGLSVAPAPNDLLFTVAGPSATVARAFGTTWEQYRDPSGRVFFSHPSAATLPAPLSVAGVYGLGNVTPLLPSTSAGRATVPGSTPAVSCSYGVGGALSPCQLSFAYDYNSLVGNGTNGSGERIGIVDAYDGGEPETELASDFATFAGAYALPTGGVSYAYPVATTADINVSSFNSGWGLEEALDLEWARATAPGAALTMTFSPDPGPGLLSAVDWLVATDSVNVISMSWGEPLTGVFNAYSGPCPSACNATTDGTLAILDPVLEVAAAEGISVFAATGDCGAADGTSGLAVNYPAADPWATAVGGTVLIADSNGSYVTETGWSGNASGATAPGCVNQGGSGGGFASLPRPAWQASLPASPPGRATPDVSLDAGTPVSVVYAGGFSAVGGTSVATPIWAGITAIADQHVGAPLGFLDPSLYQIYGSANYARDFHDVLTGSNGYAAGAGWDAVTGIGSPIVGALVTTLAGAPRPLAPPAPFLFASPRIGRAPLTVSFAVNVTGGTGTYPVEEVLFGDGNSSASASGIVTHTYPSPGVYSAQAFVLDSSDNGSSSPPLAIVVGGSTLNASLSASTEDPAVGASVTFTFGTSGGVAPLSYNLSFGDGTFLNNLTGPTATHAYAAVGGYCAEVVARDAGRPPDGGASPRVAVAVGGAPIPDCGNDSVPLTLTPAPGPEVRDASVEFVNLFSVSGGTNGPSGLVGSLQIRAAEPYVEACQCAIFRTPGTYSVTGWYNDTVNQGAEATTTVTVVPALVGTFTASALSGPAPLTVAFTAASQGGYHADPASTAWTFGNGRAELGDAVQTTYTSPGEYLATGHLEDAGHGNASEAFLIDVLPSGPPAYGVAGSIAPAVDLPSGTTVQFSGSVVGPSGGPTAVLEWNLGNGAGAFGPTPSETYYGPLPGAEGNALAGGVSAILENTEVLANVSWSLPSFFALESGGALPRVQALALASGLAPTVGHTPFTTRATAVLSGPGTPTLVWSFGDGSTNSSATVLHPYVGGGLYTATVRAGDPYGDSAVDSYAVVAYSALAVTGGPSPASGAPPLTVTYTALGLGGNGPPYTYAWVFGNGSTASGPSVVRTYASAGVYTATVTVTDRGGASVHATWTVTVSVPPAFTPAILLAIAAAAGVGIGAVAAVRARPKPGAVAPDGA